MSEQLVRIGARKTVAAESDAAASATISRRNFLKIIGGASALGLSACTDSPVQNLLPNVQGSDQQIPGVAVWYNSTCSECSAGCGIRVRTREGRAVKIEGNPESPINRGSLCALGQASLQHLYDPDRVRQPLARAKDQITGATIFKPISWDEAFGKVSEALKNGKKKLCLSGALSGATDDLLEEFCGKLGIERSVHELLGQNGVAKASEIVYGVQGIPRFSFDKAEVVLNFGSDFLETWVSPCEFARGWADGRKAEKPLRLVHVEPRLSLTGANADLWLMAKPGTEVRLALAVLKLVLERGRGAGLLNDVRPQLSELVASLNIEQVAEETGVAKAKILLTAEALADAGASLVLAGGTAASTENGLSLMVVCNFLNLVLGNVGKTVDLSAMRVPRTSLKRVAEAIDALNKNDVDVLLVHGANPAFTLPAELGFNYAARRAALVVSFSSHLDESAELADLILPSHTGLESWGDARPHAGVYSLSQPVMAPLFDTKAFGDQLIQLADRAGKPLATGAEKTFLSYLKESWKKLQGTLGGEASGDFNQFWNRSVERGGYFGRAGVERVRVQVNPRALDRSFEASSFGGAEPAKNALLLYPYPSVKGFDGRAANRPWLQELPDPMTQVVWDSWAELHPETARAHGLHSGDFVTARTDQGEITVPVYLTEHVHRNIVAVPMGQGHTSYGRFARMIGGANVLQLLSATANDRDEVTLLSSMVTLLRGRGNANLIVTQGSDDQMGRGLARTTVRAAGAGALAAGAAHGSNHSGHDAGHAAVAEHSNGHGHHEPKQMYEQRQHPLYHWGMAVDLAACTGCSACVVACYAENNIPVVGKERCSEGREMSWLRIERYVDGGSEDLQVHFLPMMCQHCNNAPCEPVCPVYATYHNEEGMNVMVYNRCVGTRYCSNNCSYKVRRFNWFEYELPEPLDMQLNPDVTKRSVGVMEKCTFCVQRIADARDNAKDLGRRIQDGEVQPACVQSCPTRALTFGDLKDPASAVSRLVADKRAYKVLDHHINTQPSVSYLENVRYEL